MKTPRATFPAHGLLLVVSVVFLLVMQKAPAQTPQPTLYARIAFHKVTPFQEAEYEKLVRENIKPGMDARLKGGYITAWRFYKVHFRNGDETYNYVSVVYHDSWAKTEAKETMGEMIRAGNPKVDAAAIVARLAVIRKSAGEVIYHREDFATGKVTIPPKYAVVDFLKVRDNMYDEYVKAEREEWKPVHQAMVDENKRAGWTLWSLVMPFGAEPAHQYVTSNAFATYEQIMAGNFNDTYKKVHPGKDPQAALTRTLKLREQVKSELWELIESVQ
jgi:hypothetical protein